MNMDLWIGTLISIPVSIVAGLMIPRIQRWIEMRGHVSHPKRNKRLKDEYQEVLYYATHSDMLIGKMLIATIMVSLYVFGLCVFIAAAPAMENLSTFVKPQTTNYIRDHHSLLVLILSILSMSPLSVWTVIVFRTVLSNIDLYYHVLFFRSYVESVPNDLRDHNSETLILTAVEKRSFPGLNVWDHETEYPTSENRFSKIEGSQTPRTP